MSGVTIAPLISSEMKRAIGALAIIATIAFIAKAISVDHETWSALRYVVAGLIVIMVYLTIAIWRV